jgi:acyl-CoA synthetase (AMP-forming)/AMP-acid ligase II
MCIRGPTVISRYLNNPTATAASFDSEGYYKTGDVMYCSSAGRKWYVVDRRKELIKVRAFQVAPAEIEGVLLSHSSISDAAVIGVPSGIDADVEHPRAYVVRSPAAAMLTENEVIDYCKERLAKYKELTGGVRFLDALPRNATGKLLKRELKAMVEVENKSRRARL